MLIDVTKTISREDQIKECCKIFGAIVLRVYKDHTESFTMYKTGNHRQYVRLKVVQKMIQSQNLICYHVEDKRDGKYQYFVPPEQLSEERRKVGRTYRSYLSHV